MNTSVFGVFICNFAEEDEESLSGMGLNLPESLLRFSELRGKGKTLVQSLIKIICRANHHSSRHVKQSFEIPKRKATSFSKLHAAKVGAVGF